MRQLLSILALLSLSAFSNANLQDFSISPEEAREILGRKLGDEIFLKERLRLENAQKKAGEIISHKVGNGFQIARPNPTLEELVKCKVLDSEDLYFILLETSSDKTVAVLTNNPERENLAEFLEVHKSEVQFGFKSQHFYSGQNLKRGEMFQLKLSNENVNLLSIVLNGRLFQLKLTCE
jgi:hypothetical protein